MFCLILPSLLLPNLLLSNLLSCDTGKSTLLPDVDKYVEARLTEFDQISEERKQLLAKFAEYIKQCQREERPCNLVFICTHNSRRSHLSQVWAQVYDLRCRQIACEMLYTMSLVAKVEAKIAETK